MRGAGLRTLTSLLALWLLCDCGAFSPGLRMGRRRPAAGRALRPGRTIQPGGPTSRSRMAAPRTLAVGRSPSARTRSPGIPVGRARSGMVRDTSRASRRRVARVPASGRPSVLSGMVGRQRLWVISAPHPSDGYYRLMLSLLKDDVYCELAERHIAQMVLFHQEGEVAGKVRKITSQGNILEEPLDAKAVLKLMDFLKLERGKFSMVLLKKNLHLEETYPYPVRLEAMYEVIDQGPIRKIERLRQKGFVQKCKAAGVEGQVLGSNQGDKKKAEEPRPMPKKENTKMTVPKEAKERTPEKKKKATVRKPIRISLNTHGGSKIVRTTAVPRTTPTSASTSKPTTTTPTTTSVPSAAVTERQAYTRSHVIISPALPEFHKPPQVAETPSRSTTEANSPGSSKWQQRPTAGARAIGPGQTKVQTSQQKYSQKDKKEGNSRQKGLLLTPGQQKPTKVKSTNSKATTNKILTNEYEDKYQPDKVLSPNTREVIEVERGRQKNGKGQKKPKKPIKAEKQKKPVKNKKKRKKVVPLLKTKPTKEIRHNNKKSKKPTKKEVLKQPKNIPGGTKSLASILGYYENRRRLLLITSPNDQSNMYEQQRDEYLEHVCEMALRKISIITLFGPLNNSTIKVDHYQLDNEKPVKDIRSSELDQHFISELRKEYGLSENEFFMVLTDLDMKVKQHYEVPISMQAVFDLIDSFTTRIKEMEKQKKEGLQCKKEDKPRSLENFLSRFRWRRRLFIISTPTDEEWAYQHQLYALNSQACNLGLRHLVVLKLKGVATDVGGVLELYPINGTVNVDREDLSESLVKDIRNYFQVSPEYFSMLLVGKDGNVKSWYPTPMWNMAIVYDLVDSMQLRRQEMAIQQSLGMRCPEDEYGYSYHGYQGGYHQQGHYGGYPY
ncbi:coiled-coil domain-containing protein 80 [Narcine bancroftii]|uniref:coiled-coil domain-containing protein 80 n=1 Tax=Narcine bancroftii TaxID=1343680 RepID=UPI0038320380